MAQFGADRASKCDSLELAEVESIRRAGLTAKVCAKSRRQIN
jgi:hypothetical protein